MKDTRTWWNKIKNNQIPKHCWYNEEIRTRSQKMAVHPTTFLWLDIWMYSTASV